MRQKLALALEIGMPGNVKVQQVFSYFAEAEKKWSLPHNYFTKFSIEGSGKYYWDNKKYNEFNGRVGAGVGYQTARFEISLMPFTERRWYAGGSSGNESMKQYSKKFRCSFRFNLLVE